MTRPQQPEPVVPVDWFRRCPQGGTTYTPRPSTEDVVTAFAGYANETLGSGDDDGTMVDNVAKLREQVVGHKITSAHYLGGTFVITLDDGRQVALRATNDCCAYTELESFLLHPERVDHIITGVGTTDGYTTWHIFADFGDVLKLSVGWSCGNPFYYSFGFDIAVTPVSEGARRG